MSKDINLTLGTQNKKSKDLDSLAKNLRDNLHRRKKVKAEKDVVQKIKKD